MPEISRLLALSIRMYFLDHAPPPFHARYGEWEAQVRIAPVGLLHGWLPPRVLALVIEWASLREVELEANWARLRQGIPPLPVAPLQ